MSLKKTLAAAGFTIGILTATAALAGGPGEFDAPQKLQHFNFYLEGMVPYATEENTLYAWDTSNATTSISTRHLNSKAGFGGTVGASYIFSNKSDVRAEYTYLPGKYKKETFALGSNNTLDATVEKKYQAVNLDIGQYWSPVQKLELHFFAGVAYRNYKHDLAATNTDASSADIVIEGAGHTTKFSGWGPRFGIDSNYRLFSWLNIIANASMSLPYGSMTGSAYVPSPQGATYKAQTDKIHKFVPELAGNLGLQLNHQFNAGIWSGLELGYKAIHLMNSDLNGTVLQTHAAGLVTSGPNYADTTFYGPYVRLSVLF